MEKNNIYIRGQECTTLLAWYQSWPKDSFWERLNNCVDKTCWADKVYFCTSEPWRVKKKASWITTLHLCPVLDPLTERHELTWITGPQHMDEVTSTVRRTGAWSPLAPFISSEGKLRVAFMTDCLCIRVAPCKNQKKNWSFWVTSGSLVCNPEGLILILLVAALMNESWKIQVQSLHV